MRIVCCGGSGMAAGHLPWPRRVCVGTKNASCCENPGSALERDELKQYPEAEAQELALIYAAKACRSTQADRLAKRLVADAENALDTLAREELGLDPTQLGAANLRAAVSSLCAVARCVACGSVPWLFSALAPSDGRSG